MSEHDDEDVPVCPICGGLCRRDILPSGGGVQTRWYGPWRCDLHGEVTPFWQLPFREDDDE